MKATLDYENEMDIFDKETTTEWAYSPLDVIRTVKYAEILPGEKGLFLDTICEKEGYELQLIKGYKSTIGYQLLVRGDEGDDDNWEYEFPYMYELDEVIAHAESFYDFRKPLADAGCVFDKKFNQWFDSKGNPI